MRLLFRYILAAHRWYISVRLLTPGALLLSNYPEKLYLYTGRKALQAPPLAGADFQGFVRDEKVDFVAIDLPLATSQYDRVDELYLWPAIAGHPEVFAAAYATKGESRVVIYRVMGNENAVTGVAR